MNRQVYVASYLNSSEAELARIRLAQEGIPAFFENANMVLWVWYYSNAVGGVKVFVPESDAERAWSILHPQDEPESTVLPPPEFPTFEEDDETALVENERDTSKADESHGASLIMPPPRSTFPLKFSSPITAAIICLGGVLLFWGANKYFPILILWAFLVLIILAMRSIWPADEDAAAPPEELPVQDESDMDDVPDDYDEIEAAVFRAWKAAVFSLFFMPLAIYSLWILMCSFWLETEDDEPTPPLRPRETRRVFVALSISILELLLFVLLLFVLWLFAPIFFL